MRTRALWAGALPTIALAAAVIGPLTASTREVQEELNGTIWVANRGTAPATADTIRAFDTRTGDVTHDVHMNPGSMPGDLAVAKGKVYVSEERGPAPAVAIVDAGTGDILGRIFTDPNSRPHHVHASAGGNLVSVGLYGTDDVLVIDTQDDTSMRWDTDTAPGHESGRIHAAVFSNDESTLYLADEAANRVIAMDPRTGTVFWRLGVPAVHELAVTHNQKLLYISRRGAGQLAVVRLHPDATLQPEGYDDVLPLGLPDTLRLSANEQLLTVGLRTSPARLAVVDTRVLEACDGAPCPQAVNYVLLDPSGAPGTIGGHQWTAPSGRYTWASFEGSGAGVVLIDHEDGSRVVGTLRYPGQPHGVDHSHP
jgi:outer membrane protein assembly factor BamB